MTFGENPRWPPHQWVKSSEALVVVAESPPSSDSEGHGSRDVFVETFKMAVGSLLDPNFVQIRTQFIGSGRFCQLGSRTTSTQKTPSEPAECGPVSAVTGLEGSESWCSAGSAPGVLGQNLQSSKHVSLEWPVLKLLRWNRSPPEPPVASTQNLQEPDETFDVLLEITLEAPRSSTLFTSCKQTHLFTRRKQWERNC